MRLDRYYDIKERTTVFSLKITDVDLMSTVNNPFQFLGESESVSGILMRLTVVAHRIEETERKVKALNA